MKTSICTTMEKDLVKDLDLVAEITGRSKASIIEEAVKTALYPFRNGQGEITAKKGEYYPNGMAAGDYDARPCIILGDKTIFGAPYKIIYGSNGILKVPAEQVQELE